MAAPFRRAFGLGLVRDGKLDLWSAAERALRAAGCGRVDRVDLCTACTPERFFSHRRDEGHHRAAGSALALSPETVRANYERIRGELGPEVTIVAATKYVERRGPGRARRGRDRGRRREPRAGPRRQARPPRRRLPLALHRPPAEPQGGGRERALRALPLALERVRGEAADDSRARRGQPLRRGVEVGDPGGRAGGVPAALRERGRPDDDAAVHRATPRTRGRTSAACASWRSATACASCRWERARTTAWQPTKGPRWCGWDPFCTTG